MKIVKTLLCASISLIMALPEAVFFTTKPSYARVELPPGITPAQIDTEAKQSGFPKASYPYAQKPDGCSFPGLTPGEWDNFALAGNWFSFTDACNEHDRCYYTLGSSHVSCNTAFFKNLNTACVKGVSGKLNPWDIATLGGNRASALYYCQQRADIMARAVGASGPYYHTEAQQIQRRYENKVAEFLRSRVAIANPPQTTFGVFAYSRQTGKFGLGRGYTVQQDAENRALKECGVSDCKAVSWFKNSYGALAQASDGSWGASWGKTKEEAAENALRKCREYARTTCSVTAIRHSSGHN